MKQHQTITSLPPSPDAERHARMVKYTVAMTIRVACIFALLFVHGWWVFVFAAGAVFLPYVAVVLANVSGPSRDTQVLRPGGIVPVGPQPPHDDAPSGAGDDARPDDARPDDAQPDDERGAA